MMEKNLKKFFENQDVFTDRTIKINDDKKQTEIASSQMLISCAILPKNANGCSPAAVDIAWKYIESGKLFGGWIENIIYLLNKVE